MLARLAIDPTSVIQVIGKREKVLAFLEPETKKEV
jgi:hypothetical protein